MQRQRSWGSDEASEASTSSRAPPDSPPKNFKCRDCGKGFAKQMYLEQHRRIHSGQRPYGPCEWCGRRFVQLSHLQQHRRTHTGERPYKCPVKGCKSAFIQLSNLNAHKQRHERDPAWVSPRNGASNRPANAQASFAQPPASLPATLPAPLPAPLPALMEPSTSAWRPNNPDPEVALLDGRPDAKTEDVAALPAAQRSWSAPEEPQTPQGWSQGTGETLARRLSLRPHSVDSSGPEAPGLPPSFVLCGFGPASSAAPLAPGHFGTPLTASFHTASPEALPGPSQAPPLDFRPGPSQHFVKPAPHFGQAVVTSVPWNQPPMASGPVQPVMGVPPRGIWRPVQAVPTGARLQSMHADSRQTTFRQTGHLQNARQADSLLSVGQAEPLQTARHAESIRPTEALQADGLQTVRQAAEAQQRQNAAPSDAQALADASEFLDALLQ